MLMILLANVFQEVKCRGTADCTATAWLMRPIAAPRMGHIGQKFEAPAVKHFPPDALGYPGDIFRPASLSRRTRDVSMSSFPLSRLNDALEGLPTD
jgi:hypothetical protein